MRYFPIVFVLCAITALNLAQTTGQKTISRTAKPKATPTLSKKATATKIKPKTAATPAKKTTGTKPKPKTVATPAKKTTAAKPKPVATPTKKPNESVAFDKAVKTDGRDARISALKKFNEAFPRSARKNDAMTIIAFLRADAGNEKLGLGDLAAAATDFTAAATDAPKPIPDQLWTEALSKAAPNLYFRGARGAAIEIEKLLESKADANVKQLLDIASFYMMIEAGGEAKRVTLNAIELDPNSSVAYQTLGLANRMDFQLFGSASAYERALELDPTSMDAKRGLAEMKRALGKPDEAVALYRDILVADAQNLPAQTGLILALFDSEKRTDAETELARSLDANPGNVILLAGAAYWYAAHNEGARAVELAQKAIDIDPRFVWSHVALARGLLLQNRAADAEKTLLAARRYGNFPTIEYELASTRLAAGYYREAAEGLSSVFKITDGKVTTKLGGRVEREAQSFTDLVGDERRASIFAPRPADNPENARRLAALLEFKQQLDAAEKNDDRIATAVDQFVKGGDRMTVYRQIFTASQLLEKKTALPKVVELTKAATSSVEAGLDVPNSSIAVMANELYENRAIAATKGDYIVVPDVPRSTLSAVLRGRLEEIAGWANYNLGSADEAIIRLRRAVGVLPANSTWWRSSTWRLGAAYALAGRDAEALDMYIKSYRSAGPDVIRYGVIEALYRKVNGNTNGLDDKIGPNPAPQVAAGSVAQKTEPTPEIRIEPTPTPTPDAPNTIPSVVSVATPTPEEIKLAATPLPDVSTAPVIVNPTPTPEPSPIPPDTVRTTVPTPSPTPEVIPEPQTVPSPTPAPSPETSPTPQPTPDENTEAKTKELFPPVIINIPSPSVNRPPPVETKPEPTPSPSPVTEPTAEPSPSPTPSPTPDSQSVAEDTRPRIVETKPESAPKVVPCRITVSEEPINLKNNGGKLAVIVGLDDDGDVDAVQASSSSVTDVTIRREPISGLTTRALFVVQSLSDRIGLYQVVFDLPCGKRIVNVNVR